LKRFLKSEAGAIVIWVLAALLVAAIAAPWAYQIGKNFAQVAATQELAPVWESLGRSCGRAKLEKYFSRAMTVSAILMLPFLMARIRAIRAASGVPVEKRSRVGWKSGALQVATGCLIAGGILLAMGMILTALGAYLPTPNPPELGKLLKRMIIPAVAASLLEEWLFRGLLLGLWLRFAKPLAASIGTSLLFAFVHFLGPPDGVVIANPASPLAGFELLGKILLHFTDPLFFVTDFATLFVIGMILATARLRTGALWFSIGLHAGWIAAFKGFNMLHKAVPLHELRPWGVGDSLRSGILPMLALGVTAVVCHFALRRFEKPGSVNLASQ
jgi:membrane protease YdiL (CAAX protease family)